MRLNNIGKMMYNPFNNLDKILERFIRNATQQENTLRINTEHNNKENTEYTTLYTYYANWKLKEREYNTALKYYIICLKQRPQSPSIMR
jgi:hypothetical protein